MSAIGVSRSLSIQVLDLPDRICGAYDLTTDFMVFEKSKISLGSRLALTGSPFAISNFIGSARKATALSLFRKTAPLLSL